MTRLVRTRLVGTRLVVRAFLGVALLLSSGCEAKQTALVAETDDESADFGRSSLRAAVVALSKSPESPQAYEVFADRVRELMPFFSRSVKREAKLRLCTLAIAPLEAGLSLTPEGQLQAFATTVWPSILEFPKLEGETPHDYADRLCASEFALDCNNVIPERWPAILNARVWRTLKNRVELAYSRCRWCEGDKAFAGLVQRSHDIHVRLELAARRAVLDGTPADWPVAGPHAAPLETEIVISFASGGVVTVDGGTVDGGDWREAIRSMRGDTTRVALHLNPERLVADLLQVLRGVRSAGYSEVALVTRHKEFPYQAVTYTIDARVKNSGELNVHNGDTIQILVQALDHSVSVKAL